MMNLRVCVMALAAIFTPVSADTLTPVDLAPMQHKQAEVTVVSLDGKERTYLPQDLEKLPTYSLTTTSPWREAEAVFEGALLTDLLAENGINHDTSIKVVAENHYTVTVPYEIWTKIPILVATRVNGNTHSRRERGPIQFVIDHEIVNSFNPPLDLYLIWMVARIEPVI